MGRHGLAYAGLNLRRNPFGELTPQERAELAVVDIEPSLSRLGAQRFALELVGAPGFGKTTHLLAVQRAVGGPLPLRGPDWSGAAGTRPLLIDDAQLLTAERRAHLLESAESCVLATHVSLAEELREHGFQVETLRPKLLLTRERLDEIVARRIRWARRGPGALPVPRASTLDELYRRHQANMRAIEAQLYEWIQAEDARA